MRRSTWITLLAAVGLIALLVWTSLNSPQAECRVCMVYGGRTECATAAAPDRDHALQTAIDTACATIAPGRAAGQECSRSRPVSEECR